MTVTTTAVMQPEDMIKTVTVTAVMQLCPAAPIAMLLSQYVIVQAQTNTKQHAIFLCACGQPAACWNVQCNSCKPVSDAST